MGNASVVVSGAESREVASCRLWHRQRSVLHDNTPAEIRALIGKL